jgi:rsbT antagonist protein RsbS
VQVNADYALRERKFYIEVRWREVDSREMWPLMCCLLQVVRVPILKQGDYVIASIQSALTDDDLLHLRDGLTSHVGQYRSKGVIVDVTALDVMDSFATRTVRDLAQMVRLRGAKTIIVGIQPEVAFAMVQLGLELGDVGTALDLEEALQWLHYECR